MPSYPQHAFTASNSIEEIVVTAQKREQNTESVRITMNVIGTDKLRARNYQNLSELASTIVNIELFEDFPSAGISTWVIRGVGLQDFNTNNTQTASVYQDFRTKFSGSQSNSVEEAIYALEGYNIFNANFDISPMDDEWKLSFWVKNLLVETYRTRVKSDGLLSYADLFGQSRRVGLALELRW